jgi:hypothetical protein
MTDEVYDWVLHTKAKGRPPDSKMTWCCIPRLTIRIALGQQEPLPARPAAHPRQLPGLHPTRVGIHKDDLVLHTKAKGQPPHPDMTWCCTQRRCLDVTEYSRLWLNWLRPILVDCRSRQPFRRNSSLTSLRSFERQDSGSQQSVGNQVRGSFVAEVIRSGLYIGNDVYVMIGASLRCLS